MHESDAKVPNTTFLAVRERLPIAVRICPDAGSAGHVAYELVVDGVPVTTNETTPLHWQVVSRHPAFRGEKHIGFGAEETLAGDVRGRLGLLVPASELDGLESAASGEPTLSGLAAATSAGIGFIVVRTVFRPNTSRRWPADLRSEAMHMLGEALAERNASPDAGTIDELLASLEP